MIIPSEKEIEAITQEIENDPQYLKLFLDAFNKLSHVISDRMEYEIRINKAFHELNRFIDHESEEWRRAYLVGHHDGMIDVLNSLSNIIELTRLPIKEVFNSMWDAIEERKVSKQDDNDY